MRGSQRSKKLCGGPTPAPGPSSSTRTPPARLLVRRTQEPVLSSAGDAHPWVGLRPADTRPARQHHMGERTPETRKWTGGWRGRRRKPASIPSCLSLISNLRSRSASEKKREVAPGPLSPRDDGNTAAAAQEVLVRQSAEPASPHSGTDPHQALEVGGIPQMDQEERVDDGC